MLCCGCAKDSRTHTHTCTHTTYALRRSKSGSSTLKKKKSSSGGGGGGGGGASIGLSVRKTLVEEVIKEDGKSVGSSNNVVSAGQSLCAGSSASVVHQATLCVSACVHV